jgi:SAM-dependent methyltransferase
LEDVACYVCGTTEGKPWATENGYTVKRCAQCGLLYVSPRPSLDNISRAAQSGLHAGQQELDVSGAYGGAGRVRYYVKKLRALYGAGFFFECGERWFDIGCGYGEFLEALREESAGAMKLVGSEPNEKKAASARGRGLDVAFHEIEQQNRRFHYVSLLNVFSHLPDPGQTLTQIREFVAPCGELLLQTGNFAELRRHEIPDQLHLPDHLSFANERLVDRLLTRAGFTLLRVRRYPMFPERGLRGIVERVRPADDARQCLDLWFRARRA